MTLARWLDARHPTPPPALRARIDAALGSALHRDAIDECDACLAAAEGIVQKLLHDDATSRDAALDLLAADALVTYAFEAASARPEELTRRATQAMSRIATLGQGGPPPSP